MRRVAKMGALLLLATVATPALATGTCCPCPTECRSPGYWMNHSEAWPVEAISIGGESYVKDEAIALMKQPVKGDKTLTMFRALVAAKLNGPGCAPCWCILKADAWMAAHPVESGVKASSDAWQGGPCSCGGEALYNCLDASYN